MKILSERTKARVIGFYIVPTPNKRTFSHAIGHSQVDWSKREEIWDEMKKNNFIVLEDTNGYEQYIWVSSKSLNINTDDVAIDSDMTKGRMKSAFVSSSVKENLVTRLCCPSWPSLCPKTVMTMALSRKSNINRHLREVMLNLIETGIYDTSKKSEKK